MPDPNIYVIVIVSVINIIVIQLKSKTDKHGKPLTVVGMVCSLIIFYQAILLLAKGFSLL